MNEQRIKHLEMIQSNIHRMSNHSSTVRNWGITATAGLIAANASNPVWIMPAIIPAAVALFAFLDHFYLTTERKFRDLYDKVRLEDGPVDFNLNPAKGKPSRPGNHGRCIYWLLWATLALGGTVIAIAPPKPKPCPEKSSSASTTTATSGVSVKSGTPGLPKAPPTPMPDGSITPNGKQSSAAATPPSNGGSTTTSQGAR
jgi:hypothetical protein